jgi:hypothetical protein
LDIARISIVESSQRSPSEAEPYGAESASQLALLNIFSLKSLVSNKSHAESYAGKLNFTIAQQFNWGGEIFSVRFTLLSGEASLGLAKALPRRG